MKIDWKHLATMPGYRSLKAAYIRDVQTATRSARPMRDKAEFLHKFIWVISRAKHYAQHFQVPIENVLDNWELNRDYWWLNYYQEARQPKFYTNDRYTRKHRGKLRSKKSPRKWTLLEKKQQASRRQRIQQESVS